MLDFGTDMNSANEPDNDDLFSNTDVAVSPAPVKKEEKQEVKRPQIKPPTLPKYVAPKVPEKNKIQPALKNNPHFLHRRRKAEEFSTEDKMEVSRILKAARKTAGLSPEAVEKSTQIRAHYLVALEEGDYDKLPQPVYVLAYLRKLCNLYDISGEEEDHLVRPWRNIPCELSEKLLESIQQDEENNERKGLLNRLEVIILAAAALIVIGIIVLVIVLIVSYFSGKDVPEPVFNNTKLLEIQPKPELIIIEQPPVRNTRNR